MESTQGQGQDFFAICLLLKDRAKFDYTTTAVRLHILTFKFTPRT